MEEARLLKERRRYQRTLQHAARGMTQVRSVTKLANLITRLVARAVGTTHASLFLWDPTHQRYVLGASHGPKRLALQSHNGLEPSHPLIQWLTTHCRVVTEEELARYPDPAMSRELTHLGVALAVPGLVERRLIGWLILGHKRSGAGYFADDLRAFSTLADEAAIAIENARSYEELLKVNEQLKTTSERLLIQERLAVAGQIATGMAHEIKNPLTAIKTFTEFLDTHYDDPSFRAKFQRIVGAEVERIHRTVQQLLDFAKPMPPRLTVVELPRLADETLELLANELLERQVEVHRRYESAAPILADPQQFKQVLLNLFLNSLQAMDGHGRLTIQTVRRDTTLVLTVIDDGEGIAPEHLPHVFEPFFTTKDKGTGLGLAVVQGIVTEHGGRVTLDSRPGQGTRVTLSFPLAASHSVDGP
ncbi:MAG: ATP-binding protein [Candidatus Omnitrophota bacterium]|nr:ATP-binding protein [Candidatus Omnitrophota bacterium]